MTRHPQAPGSQGLFVTGTDTGVGKTVVAVALLQAMSSRGMRVVGMKPVAAGSARTATGLVNDDVVALTQASNIAAPRELINPYCFEPAIAPHLAASAAGVRISLERIVEAYRALAACADRVVVEGAGGLMVPLNEREDFADLVHGLRLPVVMVVGMRLGCLNHALMTAEALRRRGLRLAGWVANRIDPNMAEFEANRDTLADRIDAPLIGTLPFSRQSQTAMAQFLRLELLGYGAD